MDFIAKEEPNNLLPDVKKKYIHISNTKTALQSVHKY